MEGGGDQRLAAQVREDEAMSEQRENKTTTRGISA